MKPLSASLLAVIILFIMGTGCGNNPTAPQATIKKDTVFIHDTPRAPIVNTATKPAAAPEKEVASRPAHHHAATAHHESGTYSSSSSNEAKEPAPAATPAPQKKKGWSDAAKGAAIGGGVGIAAGAIIDRKNPVVGGVVGGIVGGGAGYLIGRSRDRKSGRVVKRKKKADSTNTY